jgi:organic radical activating enzyme
VGRSDSTFKFVVSREEDIEEIEALKEEFGINPSQIMLMPAGYTRDDLSDTYESVAELCKESGYRFSQRLHVNLWGMATGV